MLGISSITVGNKYTALYNQLCVLCIPIASGGWCEGLGVLTKVPCGAEYLSFMHAESIHHGRSRQTTQPEHAKGEQFTRAQNSHALT